MQNEDDLRGLAKVTDFMRAISFFIFDDTHLLVLLRLTPRNGLNARYSG